MLPNDRVYPQNGCARFCNKHLVANRLIFLYTGIASYIQAQGRGFV